MDFNQVVVILVEWNSNITVKNLKYWISSPALQFSGFPVSHLSTSFSLQTQSVVHVAGKTGETGKSLAKREKRKEESPESPASSTCSIAFQTVKSKSFRENVHNSCMRILTFYHRDLFNCQAQT